MAKIVVTFNGLVQQELTITKSRLTIGRRPSNDVVIDHLTVSGQHAAVDTSSNGSFVLDLGSTNGTMVNGQPVKKHLLQHDDIIDIGKYKLRFQVEAKGTTPALSPAEVKEQPTVKASAIAVAKIKVLNGANSGKEMVLSKPVTTLGKPGHQVVAITRQDNRYVIRQVEGSVISKLNDKPIDPQASPLTNGDIVDVAGIQVQFVFM
ncbi:FHA domain-containing protein [Undibacterium sp. Ji49W]|uniref:FHA domain-containing protein n=1 Tax=Undibacterium sp. Ji49W TaxID=3413040 RepID=UPI003BF1AA2A